ncbi:hypothetical protein OG429_04110 [Streptomyces sp. NBC_00190]|uniref:hypothetical protein n=1 Tax=unclassified Streptomyces TaxID=2593676 RepID=UPI002E2D2515|nr:hypothetical protein [Streptomyces sp. NBC_00190]WSZ38580.1 hypothetical protein OG239_07115 [Streptomyces sp. NBC_00868]
MKQLRVLVAVGVLALGSVGAEGAAQAGPAHPDCPAAQIFATDNTAIITDPADPRLQTRLTRFDHEVRKIIHANGARPGASTLLDGVFWSDDLKQITYERSREFDVNKAGRDGLHHIAGVIAKQYHQESVLTFRCLPRTATDTDAVEIRADGVSATRLHDALTADPEARERLGGGSVALDGELILIAPLEDLGLARKFTAALGVDWNTARVRYGDEEFVV